MIDRLHRTIVLSKVLKKNNENYFLLSLKQVNSRPIKKHRPLVLHLLGQNIKCVVHETIYIFNMCVVRLFI